VTTAVYTGSFDPLHVGHLSIVEQASHRFEHVVVAVLGNPDKVTGMFPIADRVDMIRETVRGLLNVKVVHHAGMAVEVARDVGAHFIVRSAHKEQHHELSMALMSEAMSAIPTVFLLSDGKTSWVSSSYVRLAVTAGRIDEACAVVPVVVATALRSGFGSREP
jgi:pantetheine-phosphate adenylyltransferase